PLTYIFFYPSVEFARVEIKILILFSSLLIYLIVFKHTHDKLIAIFSMFIFGFNSWLLGFSNYTMIDFFALFLFLLGFYFWFEKDEKKLILSGLFLGLSCLWKNDFILLISPLFLLTLIFKENRAKLKHLLFPFILVCVPFEIVLDTLFNSATNYAPLLFLLENFGYYNNFIIKNNFSIDLKGSLHAFSIFMNDTLKYFKLPLVLSLFSFFSLNFKKMKRLSLVCITIALFLTLQMFLITLPTPMLFMLKILPILSILSSNFMSFLKKRLPQPFKKIIPLFLILLLVFYSFLKLYHLRFFFLREWRPDKIPYPEKVVICSNFLPAILFYGSNFDLSVVHIFEWMDRTNRKPSVYQIEFFTLSTLKNCDYLYFFDRTDLLGGTDYVLSKHPDFIKFLNNNLELIEKREIGHFYEYESKCYLGAVCFPLEVREEPYFVYIFKSF
ncbi:MAG: glycosyltransferase family 39 protein, partial [Candidatus Aenigmarchaeota archaeon]|nr:glycosyltransferase family 39 protein [Candidatus Aenigmarchaeota archaeon]